MGKCLDEPSAGICSAPCPSAAVMTVAGKLSELSSFGGEQSEVGVGDELMSGKARWCGKMRWMVGLSLIQG